MSREIKFRAWDKEKKQMVFQVSLEYDGRGVRKGYQWWQVGNDLLCAPIMQYTGLKDCKGKEIFEGDILCDYYDAESIKNGEPFKVFYNVSEGCLAWVDGSGATASFDERIANISKIIGNVYDNPELLKEVVE